MRTTLNESNKEDRSLGELFSLLTHELRTMIVQEIKLAKLEMSEKASRVQASFLFLCFGGFFVFAGFLVLLAAAVLGLALVIPLWLSALCVGAAMALIGGIALLIGRSRIKQISLVPEKTLKVLEENKRWIQNLMQ